MLERHRVRCWIAPRDITPGEEWGAAIIKGMNGSRIMVLIFSGHANASGQVRREVERAISRGMSVLPVRSRERPPRRGDGVCPGHTHWLDAFTPPLERQLELLARSVKTLLSIDAQAADFAEPTRPPIALPAKPEYRRNRTTEWAVVGTVVILVGLAILLVTFRSKEPSEAVTAAVGPVTAESRADRSKANVKRPGVSLPDLDRRPTARPASAAEEGFVPLFNGKDTSGWRLIRNTNHSWKVVEGSSRGLRAAAWIDPDDRAQ